MKIRAAAVAVVDIALSGPIENPDLAEAVEDLKLAIEQDRTRIAEGTRRSRARRQMASRHTRRQERQENAPNVAPIERRARGMRRR